MSKHQHDPENQGSNPRDHDHKQPEFWRNAHRDWRVQLVAVLMIFLMGVYVLTQDLSLRPGEPAVPPMPAANAL